jgi:putative SOS response-associated peptidase YedK
MCGRFTVGKPENIKKRFNASNRLPMFDASWNIAPSQTIPTITRNSPNKIVLMKWGFLFSKKANSGTINIRSESTKEKPYFKHFLLHNRCLIPADGFYEWGSLNLEGKVEKYPFYFYLKDRQIFGFAGLYNMWEDAEGRPFYSCAILTCKPNGVVAKVHDRMPVILDRSNEDNWLDPENHDFDKLYKLLSPLEASLMKFHPVSKRVNSPKNDDKKLIEPFNQKQLPL